MKTRMQPIANVWNKFPRVARDLALSCGKQVHIELEGEETELDKAVIEAIKDGVDTAWGIASRMRWSRPWDRIEGFMRRAAVGEAVAHMRALEERGILREVNGEPSHWEIVAAG